MQPFRTQASQSLMSLRTDGRRQLPEMNYEYIEPATGNNCLWHGRVKGTMGAAFHSGEAIIGYDWWPRSSVHGAEDTRTVCPESRCQAAIECVKFVLGSPLMA